MAKFKLTQAANRKRALRVFRRLEQAYPEAACSLDHVDPLQLLVATILSAQCTDVQVNVVTKTLFKKFKTARAFAEAPVRHIEQLIRTCGFYRMKARNIAGACRKILDDYDGQVPDTLEELLKLDGVGRKTANVVLGTAFNTPGVVVDTHCGRLARRLGFTKNTEPKKVEFDLMKIWPRDDWSLFSHLTIYHGRAVCQSRAPLCTQCPVREQCPFPETNEGKKKAK